MHSFEDLFLKSKGQPFAFNGRIIQLVDRIDITNGRTLKVRFESAIDDWRQGVCLTTDGSFEVNSQTIKKSVVLWYDTSPQEVVLQVQTKKGECFVKNVWDVGDGVMHSWHHGAAMIVEELPNGRRYRCNDGKANEDFDDLIFLIERNA